MEQPEFTALQVVVLVRTRPGGSRPIKTLFDGVSFQYQLQDALGNLLKAQLKEAEVDYEEVIISLDAPAEKAKKVEKKSSFMGRWFGGRSGER
jgi:hypothetical protein